MPSYETLLYYTGISTRRFNMHYNGKRVGFASLVITLLVCISWVNGYAQDVTGDITASPPVKR